MTDDSLKEEILINVSPREVRAALLENGILQEVYIERAARRGLISNIYKGKVSRVLPGMQAAFVEVGLERTAFLHASDIAKQLRDSGSETDRPIADIRELVRYNLERCGFDVVETDDGERALEMVEDERPSLMILDLMLPNADGLDICRMVRQRPRSSKLPIVMLTARGDDVDDSYRMIRDAGFEVQGNPISNAPDVGTQAFRLSGESGNILKPEIARDA